LANKKQIVEKFEEILKLCGFNMQYPGMQRTPERQWEVLELMTKGYCNHVTLHRMYPDFCEEPQLRLCPGIKYISFCEHHFMPFVGHAHIAYVPNKCDGKVAGLSKLPQLVQKHALRPQIQEKMTEAIALELMGTCNIQDVMVVVQGQHMCEVIEGYWRDSPYVTSSIHGRFFDNTALREETLKLMGMSV
jgi:GTP cyclohydrolase I